MKNATIKFFEEQDSQRTGSGWDFFYGVAIVNDKEFEFSLLEMNTNVGGQNTSATEITWVNDTPNESSKLEKLIEAEFEKEFS